MAFRLRRKEAVGTGVRRLLIGAVEQARDELRDEALPPEVRVHHARRGLKRARTLVTVLERAFDAEARDERLALRDAGRALSATRDADVVAKTAHDLIDEAHPDDVAALSRLAAALTERATAQRRDADAGTVARALADLSKRLDAVEIRKRRGDDPLREAMTMLYKRGRRAMERAQRDPSDEVLHEWRKAVKHRMHLAQLARRRFAAATPAIVEALDRLADLLGDDHDLAVLQGVLRDEPELAGERADAARLEARIGARRKAMQADAFGLGDILYGARPRVFRASLDHPAPLTESGHAPDAGIGATAG